MKKKGISLLTLIITIVIVIILAGIVIFSLLKSNINKKASEAVFKNDVSNLKDELQMYHYTKTLDNEGKYNQKLLYADKTMVEYNKIEDTSITMADVLTLMNKKKEYLDIFEIYQGELVYIGSSKEEKEWAEEVGVVSKYAEPKIEISSPSIEEIKAGTEVEYEITVSSNFKLEYVNFEGNIELVSKTVEETTVIKTVENEKIEVIEESEKLKKVKVIIETTGLENGEYAIVVKEKISKDEMGMENTTKKESTTFSVNTIVYEDITLTPSTTSWTNKNITVTITYPEGMTIKEYKIGADEEFKNYTGAIEIEENATVYARGKDKLGNTTENSMATLTVANIDKTVPTVTLTKTSTTTSSITVKVTASDSGGSGLNTSSYEYSKDNGATWEAATNKTEYTFSNLTSGTYEILARVKDNATNQGTSTTLLVTTTGIETLGTSITLTPSTTAWTNQNVTVTITYPSDLKAKEYKIGTGSWTTYTSAVIVTENTTVYARGKDAAGNTTDGSKSLTVSNIDKTVPTVSFSPNGGSTTSSSISTKISATDSGSGVKTVQYAWSSSTSTPTSYSTISNNTYTSKGTNGTWYLHVKITDNAGNEYITRSSSFYVNYTPENIKIYGGSLGFAGWVANGNTYSSSTEKIVYGNGGQTGASVYVYSPKINTTGYKYIVTVDANGVRTKHATNGATSKSITLSCSVSCSDGCGCGVTVNEVYLEN